MYLSHNKGKALSLTVEVLDFQYVAPFWNHDVSKVTGVGNRGQILHFWPR